MNCVNAIKSDRINTITKNLINKKKKKVKAYTTL
jgi:hypothetical protein